MSTKKKLIFFTSRFPYPLTKGDRLRAYYQIRDLSKKFDIYLLCTSDKPIQQTAKDELLHYCKEIHVFELKKWQIVLALFFNFFTKKPFQVAYFYNYRIQKQVDTLIDSIRPDHIFTQLIRCSEYVKNYHECPKTIDFMDALSKGMERRYEVGIHFWRLIYKMESIRLKEYERKIFDYFEHRIIISKQDSEYIFHPDYTKIQIIPNGIDSYFFENKDVTKENDIVFVGNLSYKPNVQATEYLYKNIYLANSQLKIQISGASPLKRILKLQAPNFRVTGFMQDIRLAYSSGKIFVAPMFIGTGLQNKLLEAMAQGLPCVTTSLVNNALGAKDGEEIWIANTQAEFLQAIQTLLSDKTLYDKLQTKARHFAHEKYAWNSINERLIDLLES